MTPFMVPSVEDFMACDDAALAEWLVRLPAALRRFGALLLPVAGKRVAA